MSTVPAELRDVIVRRLERAVEERDRDVKRLGQDATGLRQALGTLEADLGRIGRESDRLHAALQESQVVHRRDLERAAENLHDLETQVRERHREIQERLRETDERHRSDFRTLDAALDRLRGARDEAHRRQRLAAEQALGAARQVLESFEQGSLERLDLIASTMSAKTRCRSAEDLLRDGAGDPAEVLAACAGAHDSALLIGTQLQGREAALQALRDACQRDADWLMALATGEPLASGPQESLPDQREVVRELIPKEHAVMNALIEACVRQPGGGLRRWNGHAAAVDRIERTRDLLASEIMIARTALPEAEQHERNRYDLAWIWGDLELRFGRIEREGADTAGAWVDPADRKSDYAYFLRSARGELVVQVRWDGSAMVTVAGVREMEAGAAGRLSGGAQAVGSLATRWEELRRRLQNPAWNPCAGPLLRQETQLEDPR